MQLEDYFDFQRPDDIRLRGSRIGIESVLYEYLHKHRSPEEISARFPSLSLDQVYATILYYLRDQEGVGQYVEDWLEFGRRAREEQRLNPSPEVAMLIERVNELRAARAPK